MTRKGKIQVLYSDNAELFSDRCSGLPEGLVGQGRKSGERGDLLNLLIPLHKQ